MGSATQLLTDMLNSFVTDVRDAALKALGKDAAITVNGTKVSIKPANTS